MKKAVMVFIVLLFWIFLREVLAGGITIDIEIPDERTTGFAKEFILEIQKERSVIDKFAEKYVVKGYIGAVDNQRTGESKSAIGIFINDEERPVIIVWFDELFSREQTKRRAKEAAGCVFEYLRKLDGKKKTIEEPI